MTETKQTEQSETLKECARSMLDIGTFTQLPPAGADKDKNDAEQPTPVLGLFSIHRFTFIGDTVFAGQVQEVIGIAPRENVEVVTETTRRSSREDEYESTSEVEGTRSTESKDMTEVSDVVATALTTTSRASTSAKVSATCGYAPPVPE
jgi:hypothetical protein